MVCGGQDSFRGGIRWCEDDGGGKFLLFLLLIVVLYCIGIVLTLFYHPQMWLEGYDTCRRIGMIQSVRFPSRRSWKGGREWVGDKFPSVKK